MADSKDSDSGGDDNWVAPVIKNIPKPPPKKKEPPKPEEIREHKMQIVIHKIGGLTELTAEEMAKVALLSCFYV